MVKMQLTARAPIERLRTAVLEWKKKSEVLVMQLLQARMSQVCLTSAARAKVIGWVYDRCAEHSTAGRTAQLAASLLDVIHAQEPSLDQESLQSIGAAVLLTSFKIFEQVGQTSALLAGIRLSQRTLAELEMGILSVVDWALDLPLASDIADFLPLLLPETQFPSKSDWNKFLEKAYRSAAVRAGPLALALAGLWTLVGGQDAGVKLCFQLAGMTDTQAEAISMEVRSASNASQIASDPSSPSPPRPMKP